MLYYYLVILMLNSHSHYIIKVKDLTLNVISINVHGIITFFHFFFLKKKKKKKKNLFIIYYFLFIIFYLLLFFLIKILKLFLYRFF